jgi:epoxyqueuosine reductase
MPAETTIPQSERDLIDQAEIKRHLSSWASELGFQQISVSDAKLSDDEQRLNAWLDQDMHGNMAYMAEHGTKRTRPAELVDGTISIISARINYLAEPNNKALEALDNKDVGYISRYALGRDYHKLIRRKLQKLATRLEESIGPYGYRVFTDSAPVMERAIGRKAGLGWVGKHTNLIDRHTGSWFFIGEIYTDLPLEPNQHAHKNYCGSCTACIDICPTKAIVAPYVVDARRCISYLTIENKESIPIEFRRGIGNRVFGCDDCQLVCPWNRYAKLSTEPAFGPRENLKDIDLIHLLAWSEQTFQDNTQGSAIRRISYDQWLRNIAIGLGNAPKSEKRLAALRNRLASSSPMLREHIEWAIREQETKNEISLTE